MSIVCNNKEENFWYGLGFYGAYHKIINFRKRNISTYDLFFSISYQFWYYENLNLFENFLIIRKKKINKILFNLNIKFWILIRQVNIIIHVHLPKLTIHLHKIHLKFENSS